MQRTMSAVTYHIDRPILCSFSEAGRRIPIMVPTGAIVIIPNGLLDGLGLVEVSWEGKTLHIFTIDLRDRATFIGPVG